MPEKVVVDSGPLVALFDKDDDYHEQALRFIEQFRGILISNLAVVTEVAYLLDFSRDAQTDFLQWVADGAVSLEEVNTEDFERILQLTKKYSDLPMDFADVSLVAICERLTIRKVASVDRDFSIYRYRNRYTFHNVFWES